MTCITTRLDGGLGNQMFQYAAGKALACRTGLPLMLDITHLSKRAHRNYELGAFNINATTFRRPGKGKPDTLTLLSMSLGIGAKPPAPAPIYAEPHFHFDATFEKLAGPYVLEGYWQSERYFLNVAEQIRSDFSPKHVPPRVAAMQASLAASPAVSLHVRRGDYVSKPEVARFHGICEMGYYRRAMDHMLTLVPDAVFHIFSDDPQWVSTEFPKQHRWTLVDDWPSKAPWVDLWLMSQCDHHIIANSSYSWWGAWLNSTADKRVIAPARWFNEANHDTCDILPSAWIQLA